MKCMVSSNEKELVPRKAHPDDAGFDILTPYAFRIYGGQTISINTTVHVQIPSGYVGLICNKSGLAFKSSIRSETGVIDSGYTGPINVLLTNFGHKDKSFAKGDKISQLVIVPIHPDNKMELVYFMPDTQRGEGGFGSTGR